MRFGLTTAKHPGTRHDLAPLTSAGVDEARRDIERKDAGLLVLIHEASGRGDVIETLRLSASLRNNHAALGSSNPFAHKAA